MASSVRLSPSGVSAVKAPAAINVAIRIGVKPSRKTNGT